MASRRMPLLVLILSAASLGWTPPHQQGSRDLEVRAVEVLVTDRADYKATVSGAEIAIAKSGKYEFSVSFAGLSESDGIWRYVAIYNRKASSSQDCERTPCWSPLATISASKGPTNTWSYKGKKGQKLLVTSWVPTGTLSIFSRPEALASITEEKIGAEAPLKVVFGQETRSTTISIRSPKQ